MGKRADSWSAVAWPNAVPRVYDHRIRELIVRTRNPDLFPELDVPRKTALSWIHRGTRDVVTLEGPGWEPAHHVRIAKLEQRVAMLSGILRLVLTLLRISGFELERARIPDAADKRRLLNAIERARKAMPLSAALRVLRLSSSRYHTWVRADSACGLDDRSSCPRSHVQRLTVDEVRAMGDMVQSTEHRHMSIRGLALHAQRIGRVFAHPGTWSKLIRERGWRRPRLRLYPAKPKVGLRTQAPNEAWHIDVSVLKLLDGTKAYVHAVIENFSRRILAWAVASHLDRTNTHAVLMKAAGNLVAPRRADAVMDSGVENLNCAVDKLFDSSTLRRVIAQIDVSFSNSLIEAWWRTLKHQWLYLHSLGDLTTVRKLVAFYVTEHNETMPHSAFHGQTPDEMYFGRGGHIPDELAARRHTARQQRVATNRSAACSGKVFVPAGYDVTDRVFLKTSELYDPTANAWSFGAALSEARAQHTSTLLKDGKVLVAGGKVENNAMLASAELYDPAGDAWSPVGSMHGPRMSAAATLLANGDVLVVGGYATGALASAELYDSAAQTWTSVSGLSTPREYATATLLLDGRVLVTGGDDSGLNTWASAELYDPVSKTWSAAADMNEDRTRHTATLLADGRVLVVGGSSNRDNLASAELYDLDANTWKPTTDLHEAHALHSATLVDGKVWVLGGAGSPNGQFIATTESYDPANDTWTLGPPLLHPRGGHVAGLLANGSILIAGGRDNTQFLSSAELFVP